MLRYRLLLGTLSVAALAGLCWLDGTRALGAPPGAWLFPIALALSVMASSELLWLFASRDHRPLRWVVYAGNLLVVASTGAALFWQLGGTTSAADRFMWPLTVFSIAVVLGFVGEMRRYEQSGRAIVNLSLAVFSLAYIGLNLSMAVQLRGFGTNGQGMTALVSLVAVVKMCDTGAYTVGRLIGRRKMAPTLSPGKTWEGVAGGILFAVIGAGIVFAVSQQVFQVEASPLAAWRWILYGLLAGLSGLIGDLAESMVKRDMGQKDSSRWMPGFGGTLDMIDSVLLATPVAYLCWAMGLVW